MKTPQEKYPLDSKLNCTLWYDKNQKNRGCKDWTPHNPLIPIEPHEQALIEQTESVLAGLPTYDLLEAEARERDTFVDISNHLSFLDGQIVFLENDTSPIRKPQDKPSQNGPIYYRESWRMRIGTLDNPSRRFELGLAASMALCDRFGDTIRQRRVWYGAYGILLDCDEFSDGSDAKADRPLPCYTMDQFLNQYPQIKDFARYIIPSSRSLFEKRPFKARAWLPFEVPIFDYRVFQRIGEKLNAMFPFLPKGVTKNGVAVAFGAAHNAHLACLFDNHISLALIEECQREVCAKEQQRKKDKEECEQRNQARKARREQQNVIRTELKERGHDIQDTREQIQAFMEDVNPIDFMQSQGWITHVSGNEYNWHESGPGKSCEIVTSGDNQIIIKPFSASMQDASPNSDQTQPVGGHRFILHYLYGLDIKNDADKKQLRAILADEGYGTHPDEYQTIKAAERSAVRVEGLDEKCPTTQQPSPETDAQFVNSILDNTLDIPEIEVRETSAYQHWTPEQRIICEKILCRDPDAGWHAGDNGVLIPDFTTAYPNLHDMTNLDIFKMNGQPSDIEKRRIFSTQMGVCPNCNGTATLSIDKYMLTGHAYCPKCKTDIQIGSYLNYELKRRLDNAVVSKHQGYLGENPDFKSFELFRAGHLAYIGAAMATGKTTEIMNAIVQRVIRENKRGIICVPRVSLARAIAHIFRKKHGSKAWGLWHEGSGQGNQFIGTYGAIVCFPSLSHVVARAKEDGLTIKDLLIAIDELDFSYQLLSLITAKKKQIKQILQEAVNTNGLTVAGQTESTLTLESFGSELGLDTSNMHGFYNTARQADGTVEIRRYPDVEGKTYYARADAINDIRQILQHGRNVYVFCNERRDVAMLEDIFKAENPVLYTAYHKGDPRADAVLLNQKVIDTRLFLATSSAGIGINIRDEHAETIIIGGTLYGQQDIPMMTQEHLRNRARTNVTGYLPYQKTSLPIAPVEAEAVSLHEQGVKILDDSNYKKLPEDAIKRQARSIALASLADSDPMTYLRHHIESVAGMQVIETDADLEGITDVHSVKEIRKQTRDGEREAVTGRVLENLNAPTLDVLTSTKIRASGTAGKLMPMPIEQLAQERINHATQALGWDDTETEDFSFIDKSLLTELIGKVRDLKKLKQQYKGWIAVHYKESMHQQFEQQIMQNQHVEGLPEEQGGLEITDIEDTRTTGALLTELLDTLMGNVYTENTLADTVRKTLKKRHGNDTYLKCMQNGALGIIGYRAARWLHIADDAGVVKWIRDFINKWYPVRIAKRKDTYFLIPETHADLKARTFQTGFTVRSDDFDEQTPPFIDGFCEPPDPRSKEMAHAIQLVTDGDTVKDAAEKTGLPYEMVRQMTKDIRDAAKAERIELAAQKRMEQNLQDIADHFNVNKSTVARWINEYDESHIESHIVAKCTLNLQLSTRNCKKNVHFATNVTFNVTLQELILKALSTGEKSTGDIIDGIDGQPTSIKNALKALTDSKQIIKVKRGVYALPKVSEEVVQSDTQHQVSEQVSDDRDLVFRIYQVFNAILDKKMWTRSDIAAKTGMPQQICNETLNFMYDNVILNRGVSDAFWLDDDARRRCFEYVVSSARLPNLIRYHYYLSQALHFQEMSNSWSDEKTKRRLLDKAQQEGLAEREWRAALAFITENVEIMKDSVSSIKAGAREYGKKISETQQINIPT